MREFSLVDGYNVIYAWPEFEKMLENGLDHCRDQLINSLANFAGYEGSSVTVVFAAHLVKSGVEHHEIVHGIEVYYTMEGETADSLIERIVGDLGKQGNVYVVTSDWDEQKIIFGRGAYRVTPKEFRSQVKKVNKQRQEKFNKVNPTEGYLADKLPADIRLMLEKWRRRKN
ncbi:NYN domain-containing protein [Desulfotomaculum defluvii]